MFIPSKTIGQASAKHFAWLVGAMEIIDSSSDGSAAEAAALANQMTHETEEVAAQEDRDIHQAQQDQLANAADELHAMDFADVLYGTGAYVEWFTEPQMLLAADDVLWQPPTVAALAAEVM